MTRNLVCKLHVRAQSSTLMIMRNEICPSTSTFWMLSACGRMTTKSIWGEHCLPFVSTSRATGDSKNVNTIGRFAYIKRTQLENGTLIDHATILRYNVSPNQANDTMLQGSVIQLIKRRALAAV